MMQELTQKIEAAGGDDVVFDAIADGQPIREIAERFDVSRPMMYQWRDRAPHKEERRERWDEAMSLSASSHVEDAGLILDELADPGRVVTQTEVRVAEGRANHRRWMGQKLDKERFGNQPETQINLSVHDLHLQALKKGGTRQLEDGEVQEADFEVVDGEDDGAGEVDVAKELRG